MIRAGVKEAGGELVFYGVRIRLRELPGTTFGIMAGLRDTAGRLTPEVEANETAGPDTATGFHAVQAASSVGSPAAAIPEFGYYAGPATRHHRPRRRPAGPRPPGPVERQPPHRHLLVHPPGRPGRRHPDRIGRLRPRRPRLPAGNPAPGRG